MGRVVVWRLGGQAIWPSWPSRRPTSTDRTRNPRGARLGGWPDSLSWWDSAELWLSGRGFVLQTLIIMPIVLALAFVIAVTSDVLLGNGIELFRRSRGAREGEVSRMPRSRVTLALVALLVMVVLVWVLNR